MERLLVSLVIAVIAAIFLFLFMVLRAYLPRFKGRQYLLTTLLFLTAFSCVVFFGVALFGVPNSNAASCMSGKPPKICQTDKEFHVGSLKPEMIDSLLPKRLRGKFKVCGWFFEKRDSAGNLVDGSIAYRRGLSRAQIKRVIEHEKGHWKCVHPKSKNPLFGGKRWVLRDE